MVSIEEIKTILSSEEKILWKKQNYTNELKGLRFTFIILTLTVGVSIFSILFYFLTSKVYFNILLSFFISLTILLISGFPLYLFFRIFSEYKEIIKRLELKLSDLKRYEEFFMLTNKKWIQKSFNLVKVDDFNFESDLLLKQKDLAFVSLDSIEVIYITTQKKRKIYNVNLFRRWDKYLEESVIHVFLQENDFLTLIETLRKLFHISKEEHNVIKHGDSVFYCKKKKEPEKKNN